jgi:anti-sigma factor (TIGR02949 family)
MTPEQVAAIDCDEALELLHEYLKQRLTPELGERVRAHIIKCRPCLSHSRFETNYLRMLEDSLRSITCPPESRERILTAIDGDFSIG